MKRSQILNLLFWILLIIGIILLVWYIFGNTPTELAITITFILTLMFKMWAISDELKEFKHEVKFSFHRIKEDINNVIGKLDKIKRNKK